LGRKGGGEDGAVYRLRKGRGNSSCNISVGGGVCGRTEKGSAWGWFAAKSLEGGTNWQKTEKKRRKEEMWAEFW